MLEASRSQIITVALRRVDMAAGSENILEFIPKGVTLLPNTSGARTAEEAVFEGLVCATELGRVN